MGLPVQVDQLDTAQDIREIMGIEGVVAAFYWHEIQKIILNKLEFSSRAIGRTARTIFLRPSIYHKIFIYTTMLCFMRA